MDSCLEKIVFPDDRVEEGLHVDSAILIPIELQESGGTKEMSEFEWKFGCHCQKRIIVESFFVVMRRGYVLFE